MGICPPPGVLRTITRCDGDGLPVELGQRKVRCVAWSHGKQASVYRQVVGSSPLEIHARLLSPTLGAQSGLAECQMVPSSDIPDPPKPWQSGKVAGQVLAAQGVPTSPLLAPRGKVAPRWHRPQPATRPVPRLARGAGEVMPRAHRAADDQKAPPVVAPQRERLDQRRDRTFRRHLHGRCPA